MANGTKTISGQRPEPGVPPQPSPWPDPPTLPRPMPGASPFVSAMGWCGGCGEYASPGHRCRAIAELARATAAALAEAEQVAREARRLAWHRAHVHTRPQPGCPDCPPTACRCGVPDCTAVAEHTRAYAGSETTWREVASR
jgi:hypothetical protein